MDNQLNDPDCMGKYDLVLDLVAHPENYSDSQIEKLLSDSEVREIYNLMSKSRSSLLGNQTLTKTEVEYEWQKFARRNTRSRFILPSNGSRAASIIFIAMSSIVAVAIGIGVSVFDCNNTKAIDEAPIPSDTTLTSTTYIEQTDSIDSTAAVTIFENGTLNDILKTISTVYGVSYNYKQTQPLYLYFRLDPSESLDEVIERLNTFNQINISRNGDTLTVD